jgi:hypothetical protein
MGDFFSGSKPKTENLSPSWQGEMGSALSSDFMNPGSATTALGKLLNPANFDVSGGQEWKGLREQSYLAENKAQDLLKRQGSAGGWLYSDPYNRAAGDTAATFAANRDATLGGLQTQEQNTQLTAMQNLMSQLMGYQPQMMVQPGTQPGYQSLLNVLAPLTGELVMANNPIKK